MSAGSRFASNAVISGIGLSEIGKIYGRTPAELAAQAVSRALADARLDPSDVDGLLINPGISGGLDPRLQRTLGFGELDLLQVVQSYGATATTMVAQAALAVSAGQARTIVCVFADAPLSESRSAGDVYANVAAAGRASRLRNVGGLIGPTHRYALAARRYLSEYGLSEDTFAPVALQQRRWAALNPLAQLREELTLEAYLESRVVADPLRKFDCCLVSNGAVALIVTSEADARAAGSISVPIRGFGQAHPGYGGNATSSDFGLRTGARHSGQRAFEMAGLTAADIDVAEIYDCYTYTVLITLEDYGFCEPGQAGAFVAEGETGPGGSLPTNTGGGQLSSYYLWGMTPLSEAVIQARGEAGERQIPSLDHVLVSGNGGALDSHGTLILGAAT